MHTRKKQRQGRDTMPTGKSLMSIRWQSALWLAVVAFAFALVALTPVVRDEVDQFMPAAGAGSTGPGVNDRNRAAPYTSAAPLNAPATANRAALQLRTDDPARSAVQSPAGPNR
ncbi:MAG: hypothetical protein EPN61_03860 [Burkholderiaceae bacterium]|nr:MAG: hypothetical protein EPN61_03860 [Burkholderiaceae bacterium]